MLICFVILLGFSCVASAKDNFVKKTPAVHYNWGYGSPALNIPNDHFSALFDQSQTLNGDYFVQTLADDRVKMAVDGKYVINRWSKSSGALNRAILPNLSGYHIVQTHYYEDTGAAAIYSDIVPFDSWLAYYYNNMDLKGKPVNAQVIKPNSAGSIYQDPGRKSPMPKVQSDKFSARYVTAKHLSPGDYIIRARADDGVKVYLDGKLVIDRWSASQYREDAVKVHINNSGLKNPDVHWIEVQYYDKTGIAKLNVSITPYNSQVTADGWLGEVYPNKDLQGIPYIVGGKEALNKIKDINFDWGHGSPYEKIPNDNFSAEFKKKLVINSTDRYQFNVWADDGARVYVDNKLVIDSWGNGKYKLKSSSVSLNKGIHDIKIDYYEATGSAKLKFEVKQTSSGSSNLSGLQYVSSFQLPVYSNFEQLSNWTMQNGLSKLSYGDKVQVLDVNQYAAKVKTSDGKIGWVQSAYLTDDLTNDWWYVKDSRTLRSGPGTNYKSTGSVDTGSKVKVLEQKITSGTYSRWCRIQTDNGQEGWIWGALSTDGNQGYDLIKYEFDKVGQKTNDITIFTPLNKTQGNVTSAQINAFIYSQTGGRNTMMTGMGDAFLQAAKESGLNVIYVVSHAGLESGWGTSGIVNKKYNFYGIGAVDSQPAQGAFTFNTPEGGIIAGAIWIDRNFVDRQLYRSSFAYTQPTLDNLRNDNSWHQYATDDAWAVKIAAIAQKFNNFINGN
ncbi:PA14 domain-containing protein [Scopulibacillus cellulosilyticus]|uniref:PA14 domain-containing protein n=1 Tax=Scopulibacillus cellulosilyticus TaxID=2665665 RepID=A0ABW2PZ97_9BACL